MNFRRNRVKKMAKNVPRSNTPPPVLAICNLQFHLIDLPLWMSASASGLLPSEVCFYVNGDRCVERDLDPRMTLLEYLRLKRTALSAHAAVSARHSL